MCTTSFHLKVNTHFPEIIWLYITVETYLTTDIITIIITQTTWYSQLSS